MLAKLARSAPRSPFAGARDDGSRPRHQAVLPERGKTAKVHNCSGSSGESRLCASESPSLTVSKP